MMHLMFKSFSPIFNNFCHHMGVGLTVDGCDAEFSGKSKFELCWKFLYRRKLELMLVGQNLNSESSKVRTFHNKISIGNFRFQSSSPSMASNITSVNFSARSSPTSLTFMGKPKKNKREEE